MMLQRADSTANVFLAFPTPIYRFVRPETKGINDGLRRIVLDREANSPSTVRSNVGGWQSDYDLLNWPEPEINQLKEWVNEAFGEMMAVQVGPSPIACRLAVTAWANINRRGDFNRGHTHSTNHWSGVYYVDTGQPVEGRPLSGAIEFTDPRPAIGVYDIPGAPQASTWTITPEPGLMLLFPSWLRHTVLPYEGPGERITIAFNIRVHSFDMKNPGGTAPGGP
jgi:uncharacterized protein (TIGR02466 family)